MPNVSTYIRTEDLSKYLAIHDKGEWAEFIHNALNPEYISQRDMPGFDHGVPTKPIKTPKEVVNAIPAIMGTSTQSIDPICKRHHVPMSICKGKH